MQTNERQEDATEEEDGANVFTEDEIRRAIEERSENIRGSSESEHAAPKPDAHPQSERHERVLSTRPLSGITNDHVDTENNSNKTLLETRDEMRISGHVDTNQRFRRRRHSARKRRRDWTRIEPFHEQPLPPLPTYDARRPLHLPNGPPWIADPAPPLQPRKTTSYRSGIPGFEPIPEFEPPTDVSYPARRSVRSYTLPARPVANLRPVLDHDMVSDSETVKEFKMSAPVSLTPAAAWAAAETRANRIRGIGGRDQRFHAALVGQTGLKRSNNYDDVPPIDDNFPF